MVRASLLTSLVLIAIVPTRVLYRTDAASERWESSIMQRYFFDIYDGDDCVADDEGMELPDIALVQDEAVQSLADVARNAGKAKPSMGNMSIKVRDVRAVGLQPRYLFEIKHPNYLN